MSVDRRRGSRRMGRSLLVSSSLSLAFADGCVNRAAEHAAPQLGPAVVDVSA